ncbi:MAG: LacI family transcriptional regulator, partial [Erythrobacter sp. RIFCSPHIGHO2_12_FULL_63_10]
YGYRMMVELVDTHNDHVERELTATIAALQPDGVILTPPHSENPLIIGLLAREKIPFARIGSLEPGPGIRLTMGDREAAALATNRLVELGHRRIGFIAGSNEYSLSQWRIDGWREAMAQADLPSEGLCQRGDFGYESGARAANALLALVDRPTAIIASSDQMALATLEVARTRHLEIPRDLSLVSFDNTPIVRFTQPPLTAIDQPIAETISKAVELLINAPRRAPPTAPINVQGSLVERGSIGPAPGPNGA